MSDNWFNHGTSSTEARFSSHYTTYKIERPSRISRVQAHWGTQCVWSTPTVSQWSRLVHHRGATRATTGSALGHARVVRIYKARLLLSSMSQLRCWVTRKMSHLRIRCTQFEESKRNAKLCWRCQCFEQNWQFFFSFGMRASCVQGIVFLVQKSLARLSM